ncbi:ThiF family adenylyltransferase [Candidatus Woesearchaeota archaeon]|nr:ThiF family adenylyltransferase [Candidatus Woesearchaeota archaeon]
MKTDTEKNSAHSFSERVKRQKDIVDQEALYKTNITLIGGTLSAEFVLAGLAGLGVGTVGIIAENSANGFFDPLATQEGISGNPNEILAGLATWINFEQNYIPVDDPLPNSLIIDCGVEEREYKHKGHYVRGVCSKNTSAYGSKIEHKSENESPIAACVLGGALTQVARQYAHEKSYREWFSFVGSKPSFERALFVGGGATGTWSTLVATLAGLKNFDILDDDDIEGHNLNRQILFYNRIAEQKAETLHERLGFLGKKGSFSLDRLVEENKSMLADYDVLFSCVDNLACRRIMNDYAIEQGVRLVNGGTSAYGGNVSSFAPGETSCIACRTEIDGEEPKIDGEVNGAGCPYVNNPSIIMPNMIIGALMIDASSWSDEHVWRYDCASNSLFATEVDYTCRDACSCGGLRDAQ